MSHHHHHHGHVSDKTIKGLIFSFILNISLSIAQITFGIISGSISLIGDALHNTFDAFSILIAVIAFKIGKKASNQRFSFGYKRAEVLGGFINLILLFVSGSYLMVEAVSRFISPKPIDAMPVIYIALLALVIDSVTALISLKEAKNNSNMKMLFLHNLSDALGSVGVLISGLCARFFGWMFVDALTAFCLALYMMKQAVNAFMPMAQVLMNALPDGIETDEIRNALLKIDGIKDVHHIHIWNIDEHNIALDCHVVAEDMNLLHDIKKILDNRFHIHHSTIQMEKTICDHSHCS